MFSMSLLAHSDTSIYNGHTSIHHFIERWLARQQSGRRKCDDGPPAGGSLLSGLMLLRVSPPMADWHWFLLYQDKTEPTHEVSS
jgi:hypothetical protein